MCLVFVVLYFRFVYAFIYVLLAIWQINSIQETPIFRRKMCGYIYPLLILATPLHLYISHHIA